MTLKLSETVRNAMLDALEAAIGASPVLKIRSGAAPASTSDADSGTVLASMTLPADWMAVATGGSKAKSGTWADAAADSSGEAGHFRIYAADGVTVHLQGSVTDTGLGGDLQLDDATLTSGESVTVTGFTLSAGNG